MNVLVLGGTRGVGRETALVAHAAAHLVTVFARNPAGSAMPMSGVRTVVGDVRDADDLDRAVAGQHAVVWSVGVGVTRRPVDVFSRGTQLLLAAMTRHGVPRFLCVTGIGAGDSRGHGGWLYDRIVLPLFMKTVYEDKDRQEALVRASPLDWTIIRPGFLTSRAPTGLVRPLTTLDGVTGGRVSRADVAAFIVENLGTADYRRTAVLLTP